MSLTNYWRGSSSADVRYLIIPDFIMNSNQASLMRLIVLGLVLMLLMIYRPQGIFGDRRELAIDGR